MFTNAIVGGQKGSQRMGEQVGRKLLSQGSGRPLPKGAKLIIAFEFWERFGFYTTLSLLALFLTAVACDGGFDWSDGEALQFVGAYAGLMFALPLLGGFVADRWLGHGCAILAGGLLMMIGYAALAGAALLVDLAGEQASVAAPSPSGAVLASFWIAIFCLILGNALVKSTLVVVLGDTFAPEDPERERAYGLYYMGINLGGLIAGIAAGSMASAYGWYVGFAMASGGTAVAVVLFLALRRNCLQEANARRLSGTSAPAVGGLSTKKGLAALLALAVLLCVYEIGAFQLWGTWSIVLERHVDRTIGSFTIPTQWFTALNAASLIVAAPLLGALWARLERGGRQVDIWRRYALALLLGAFALGLFALSSLESVQGHRATWYLPGVAIIIMAIAEVVAWTSTYGIVYQLAPPAFVAATMGAYYAITLGGGGYLAGWVGRFADGAGYPYYFFVMALVTAAAAAAALCLRILFNPGAGPMTTSAAAGGQ